MITVSRKEKKLAYMRIYKLRKSAFYRLHQQIGDADEWLQNQIKIHRAIPLDIDMRFKKNYLVSQQ